MSAQGVTNFMVCTILHWGEGEGGGGGGAFTSKNFHISLTFAQTQVLQIKYNHFHMACNHGRQFLRNTYCSGVMNE